MPVSQVIVVSSTRFELLTSTTAWSARLLLEAFLDAAEGVTIADPWKYRRHECAN